MEKLHHDEDWAVCQNAEGDLSVWQTTLGSVPPGWRVQRCFPSRQAVLAYLQAEGEKGQTKPRKPIAPLSHPPLPRSLLCPYPHPEARARVFCFPHAGAGAASYHFLAKALRGSPCEVVLVQYPGRETRLSEGFRLEMEALTADLRTDIPREMWTGPFFFFGHSMGALVAFELTHALRASGLPLPSGLFLSGRAAPDLANRELPVEDLSDDAFLKAVAERYQAIPQALLDNPELLGLVLGSLRADFTLMRRYQYRERPLLDLPLVTINGESDPWVTPDGVAAWQKQTRGPMQQFLLTGDHFYLNEQISKIVSIMQKTIRGIFPALTWP